MQERVDKLGRHVATSRLINPDIFNHSLSDKMNQMLAEKGQIPSKRSLRILRDGLRDTFLLVQTGNGIAVMSEWDLLTREIAIGMLAKN